MKQIILLNLLLLTLIITGWCTENNSNESKQKQESSTQVTEKVSDNQVSEPITEENQELVDTLIMPLRPTLKMLKKLVITF